MRIESKLFLILLVGAILLVGCTQQPPAPGPNQTPPANQTPTPPQNQTPTPPANQTPTPPANQTQTPPPAATVGMDQLYIFGSVKSYEYKITTSGTAMNLKTSISSDTVNGTAAWLQQTDMTVQDTAVTSKMWLDKVTYKCLKTMTVMNYGGQNIEQTGQCPTEGPNSGSGTGTATPQMTFVGIESVTVPAGTFTATKYSLEQVYYWSASTVPVPVKIAYSDGTITMELVSYAS